MSFVGAALRADLKLESQSCGVHVLKEPPPPGRAQQSVRTVYKKHEHHLSTVVIRSSIVGKLRSGEVTILRANTTEGGWVGEGSCRH